MGGVSFPGVSAPVVRLVDNRRLHRLLFVYTPTVTARSPAIVVSPRRARFHRAKTATRARSDRIRKHLETANIKLGNVARSPSSSRVSAIARRAEEANAGLRSEGQDR